MITPTVTITATSARNSFPSLYNPKPSVQNHLRFLGLTYMEPDSGDFAIMVEGLIRCLPQLTSLSLRINQRQNDSHYDFFSIPRDYLERQLRRLEARTTVNEVTMELMVRMMGSRKSYADDLVASFERSRMKVKFHSPVGRIG
jgi:hypothetical protein